MLHIRSAQVSAQEFLAVFRRRRNYFYAAAGFVIVVSVAGAFLLPKKYESSTTILAQRDEVLNPLVNYSMAVSMASEDRLRTFNEIVFSLSSVQNVIDSLGLENSPHSEAEHQEMIKQVTKNIETERPGSATFRISYYDSDPLRAQEGVSILARYFITTVLSVENQRNELAVEFFQSKLDELRQQFEGAQKDIVSLMKDRIGEMPVENQTLWTNIDDDNKRLGTIDDRTKELKRGSALLAQFSPAQPAERNLSILYELQTSQLPHATDLLPIVSKYDEVSRRYTAMYPETRKLLAQITDLLGAMKSATDAELESDRHDRAELETQRNQMVENLKQSTAYQQIDQDKKSSFDVVRSLYDEMKVKLEQARTTRDLGRKGKEEFVLIDPPLVPTSIAKPNRVLLIAGGFSLGLLVGAFAVATAELLDPTIRGPRDVYAYKKNIVAFLPGHIS